MRVGIRTKEACKIAGIDPARFNDMVHSGQFPCAPKTRPGSVRMFDLDQIVSMKIFGELLSLSVSPVKAGLLACEAYRSFAGKPDVEQLVCQRDVCGSWNFIKQVAYLHMPATQTVRLVFDVSELREQVSDNLDWYQKFGKGGEDATP